MGDKTSAATFCAVMNMPNPPSRFQTISNILVNVLKETALDSMKEAVQEAVESNNGSTDLTVTLDGTWQKRDHKSLNVVVSATSINSGKVVDVDILSKYCQRCKYIKDEDTKIKHSSGSSCSANYVGVSGFSLGPNMIQTCRTIDHQRIQEATRAYNKKIARKRPIEEENNPDGAGTQD